jgi:translation initiation factor IF-3
MAELKNLDLVETVPNSNPPVCKIIDYGKFLYEVQKKEKSQKKTQTQQLLKEIRFK